MGRVKAAAKGSPDKGNKRKQRRKKDKDSPKRPCTAFFYYVVAQREIGEHEGMKVSEFTKQCGARWRSMTDLDKACHFTNAEKDKKRYVAEMAIYKPTSIKDSTKPKKPMTPFLLFVASVRKELVEEGCKPKEVLGQAAERWRACTEADKKPLVKDAAELKKAYEVEMKKWNDANAAAAKAASKPKAVPQKNGKESDDGESEEEESEEEDDDDEDMESDDE